jgi:hypothetical protein
MNEAVRQTNIIRARSKRILGTFYIRKVDDDR